MLIPVVLVKSATVIVSSLVLGFTVYTISFMIIKDRYAQGISSIVKDLHNNQQYQ